MNNADSQYLNLIQDILNNGNLKITRAGEVLSVFGRMLHFNLQEGLPILTTKKVFAKGCIHELLWFLKGNTNIRYLVENNVHIWDDDAYRYYCDIIDKHNAVCQNPTFFAIHRRDLYKKVSKEEFIEKVKNRETLSVIIDDKAFLMSYTPNCWEYTYVFGDLGDVYGKQWRNWYGVDQIQQIINTLRINPDDRRMLCVTFNPAVVDKVALPPCHVMFQFYTRELTKNERIKWLHKNGDGKYSEEENITIEQLNDLNVPQRELSLLWTQRSVDVALGLPFNILSYAILTHLCAQITNMTVGDLICSLGDTHIYTNQSEGIKEQLERDPHKYNLPTIEINKEINDINNFTYDDIKIIGYESYPKISMPLSVG